MGEAGAGAACGVAGEGGWRESLCLLECKAERGPGGLLGALRAGGRGLGRLPGL